MPKLTDHTDLGVEARRRRAAEPEILPPPPADAIDRATARRLFAAAALTGILAGTEPGARWPNPTEAARASFALADALVEHERQTGDHHEAQE